MKTPDNSSARAAFTLLELLIVIGIIAVLAAVGLTQFRGSTDSARSAQCMSNLRNLSNAVLNYGMTNHYYPWAGSVEYVIAKGNDMIYGENKGWISWLSRGKYNDKTKSSLVSSCGVAGFASGSKDDRTFAITNGTLWKFTGRVRSVYKCPLDDKDSAWSYVMNAKFGFDTSLGSGTVAVRNSAGQIEFNGGLTAPDRTLLFAEIPFADKTKSEIKRPEDKWGMDCTLQYDHGQWSGTKETIGVNHLAKIGKQPVAHVSFADGHVSELTIPKSLARKELQDLTKYLCDGVDYVWDGNKYTTP